MWNIFEYPFVGVGIAVLLMIGLWLLGILYPAKKRRWYPLVPIGVVILSFAVAYFVQTDREKILGAINTGIKAFEEQKIELIKEIIADDYSDAAHSSKELVIAYCQALFQTATVEKITIFSREIKIEGEKATFTTESLVKFTEESEIAKMGKPFLIVKARFYFKTVRQAHGGKTPQRKWLINSYEILELDRKPVNWGDISGV